MEGGEAAITVTDIDGTAYRTVRIGTQVWMAESLRATRKPDGTPVKRYAPNDDHANVTAFGYLYDWETACQICPPGWRLPDEAMWGILESSLGDLAAGKLKDTRLWAPPNVGATNETGFSARPAGYHNDRGFENNFGLRCIFWSATRRDSEFVWTRVLSYDHAELRQAQQHPQYGFSVRCVRGD